MTKTMDAALDHSDIALQRAIKAARQLSASLRQAAPLRQGKKTSALSLADVPGLDDDLVMEAELQALVDAMSQVLMNIEAAPDLSPEDEKALLLQAAMDMSNRLQAIIPSGGGKSLRTKENPAARYVAFLNQPSNIEEPGKAQKELAKRDPYISPHIAAISRLAQG